VEVSHKIIPSQTHYGAHALFLVTILCVILFAGIGHPVFAGLIKAMRFYEKAEELVEAGQYEEALNLIEKALQEKPNSAEKREGMFSPRSICRTTCAASSI